MSHHTPDSKDFGILLLFLTFLNRVTPTPLLFPQAGTSTTTDLFSKNPILSPNSNSRNPNLPQVPLTYQKATDVGMGVVGGVDDDGNQMENDVPLNTNLLLNSLINGENDDGWGDPMEMEEESEESCPDGFFYHIRGRRCVPYVCIGGNKMRDTVTGECIRRKSWRKSPLYSRNFASFRRLMPSRYYFYYGRRARG